MTTQKQNLPAGDVSECKSVTLYFRQKSPRDALILAWAKRRSMSMSDALKDVLYAQVVREVTEFANEIHGESPVALKHMTATQILTMITEWDAPVASKKTTTTKTVASKKSASDKQNMEEEKTHVKPTHNQKPAVIFTGDEQPF